jgi:hypothetical protein
MKNRSIVISEHTLSYSLGGFFWKAQCLKLNMKDEINRLVATVTIF